eukprot:m.1350 g.1350  ORF g.1350 m.1350 type:complete len:108 (+) comp1468_c0_seq1:125-448(+)
MSGDPWKGTVRSVEIYWGQYLSGYSAVVAMEPSSIDFHPSNNPDNSFPGYGVHSEYIAAFYSKGSVGLFASIKNPFGIYVEPAYSGVVDIVKDFVVDEMRVHVLSHA